MCNDIFLVYVTRDTFLGRVEAEGLLLLRDKALCHSFHRASLCHTISPPCSHALKMQQHIPRGAHVITCPKVLIVVRVPDTAYQAKTIKSVPSPRVAIMHWRVV